MASLDNAEYTLYSSPFSLYSAMARHTIYLGRTTAGAKPPKNIALKFINHQENENLGEDYLVHVNPKGQVPSMTGNVLKAPLTDSISISQYLAETHYPAMLPAEHAAAIRDLMTRLHTILGRSIAYRNPTPEMVKYFPSPAEEYLQRTDLSPEYRKALEGKLKFHNENNGKAFHPDVVAKADANLKAIYDEIVEIRKTSGSFGNDAWTFGDTVGPTVLDSHLVPFVLRCIEAGCSNLVPEELQRWAKVKEKSPSWENVMHGRPTVYKPSMGPVSEMKDMMTL